MEKVRAEVRKCGKGEGGSVEKVTTAIGVRVRTRRLPGERGMMRAAGLREWSVSKPCKGGGRKGGKGDDGSWRQGKNQEIAQRKGNDEGRWRQEWSVSKPCKGEGGSVEKVTTAAGVRVRTRRFPGERGVMRAVRVRSGA